MKTAPGVNAKLCEARRKLNVLNRSIVRFAEGEPYSLRADEALDPADPSLYHFALRVFQHKRLPAKRWSIWIDEITYHLRSALDGAVYDISASAMRPEPTGTGFPIALERRKFDRTLIRYLTRDKRAFIKSVQPYDRPADPLWFLHEMNRRNKHRLPRFTSNIVGLDQRALTNNLNITVTDLDLSKAILHAAIRAESGAEFVHLIYRKTGPNPHVKVNMKLQIDIELEQWRLTGDEGLVSQTVTRVEEVISTLYSRS